MTTKTQALDFDRVTGKRATHENLSVHPREEYVLVRNESHADPTEHEYQVPVVDGEPIGCTCPAYKYHDGDCKHMVRVACSPAVSEVSSR